MKDPEGDVDRDFTVAVFVLHRQRLAFVWHQKLQRWLPPGGHIELNELPDETAVREVREETGLDVRLIGEPGIGVDVPGQPRQLIRPEGIQLEAISKGHEHIDLIYFARLEHDEPGLPSLENGGRWLSRADLSDLLLTDELLAWCDKALGLSAP